MPSDYGKRLTAALLDSVGLAVALVAALTTRAAQLGGGWLAVLTPFALVLAVPLAALAWLYRAGTDTDQLVQTPSGPDHEPAAGLDRTLTWHTIWRVA